MRSRQKTSLFALEGREVHLEPGDCAYLFLRLNSESPETFEEQLNEPEDLQIPSQLVSVIVNQSIRVDLDHFIGLALAEFKTLHTGNTVRFGIKPLEVTAWQEKHEKYD